ncbi:MAG: hypothetical protein MJD61_19225 [Proteobacteria bacterium]|nr:hypothetical protein [Pseudomonadota bacterium]
MPLLVPSFSSKGFPTKKSGASVIAEIFEGAAESITASYLVSGYDIHHELLPSAAALPAPDVIFLDSGGYELRIEHDLSADRHVPHSPLEWNRDTYDRLLESWPEHVSAAMVSYDEPELRVHLDAQLESARESLLPRKHLRVFLLKPETTTSEFLTGVLSTVRADPSPLSDFNIIGLTEEELGSSLLDRMENIALLRLDCDAAGVDVPIHIFGALDALTTLLYFVSGADVFDGLSWLRYGFTNGTAISRRNYAALVGTPDTSDQNAYARMVKENIFYLERMRLAMSKFAIDFDFSRLGPSSTIVREAFDALRTRAKLRRRL